MCDVRHSYVSRLLCSTVVVLGFPLNLYTKLTETPRQILTTFPMNMC